MRFYLKFWLSLVCFFLWVGKNSTLQAQKEEIPQTTRILFVLDASGSMNTDWDGSNRMEIARQILSELIDSVAQLPYTEVGLRIYGHQFYPNQKNCQDTKLEVPIEPKTHNQIRQKLYEITAKGTTPIAYSLEQAAKDFAGDARNTRNIIILITDGIEACNGDPCAVSRGLQEKNIFLRPFVVGMGIELKYLEAFACMGRFLNAQNGRQFKNALSEVMQQTLGKTTVSVELLDDKGQMREKDVNVAFFDANTGRNLYNIVHFRDKAGRTDLLKIDPVPTYDIVVYTTPPVFKKGVEIVGGRHNAIKIAAPQGILQISQKGAADYSREHAAIIRQKGKAETLLVQKVNEPERLLVGKYEVEVLTRPRLIFKDVEITQGKTTKIDIPSPGMLTILNKLAGFASLYVLKTDGSEEWVCNLPEPNITQTTLALQPGRYKFVYRAAEAADSSFSKTVYFDITSGGNFNINVFKL
jgi:Ca-activated chloride channel family protein